MAGKTDIRVALILDALSLLAGWSLLLALDPRLALLGGGPVAALLLLVLRRLKPEPRPEPPRQRGSRAGWAARLRRLVFLPGTRFRGRLAAAIVLPLLVLPLGASLTLGAFAPVAGLLVPFALLAAAELWQSRRGRSLLRRFPLGTALCALVAGYALSLALLELGAGPWPSDAFIKRLSLAPEAPRWPPAARAQAMIAIRELLQDPTADPGEGERRAALLSKKLAVASPELLAAASEQGVYVTLHDSGGRQARGFSGPGADLDSLAKVLRAAADAMGQRAITTADGKGPARTGWASPAHDTRIQLDVAGLPRKVTRRPIFEILSPIFRLAHWSFARVDPLGAMLNLAFETEPGVDGLLLSTTAAEAGVVILPADPVTRGWLTPRVRGGPAKLQTMLERALTHDPGARPSLSQAGLSASRFRTASFLQLHPNGRVFELFRGNTLLAPRLSRELLVERTALAADWLSRQVRKTEDWRTSGRFRYEAFAPYRSETSDYNLPRHAGSVYGLNAFYRASRLRPAFERAGERALDAGLAALAFIERNLGAPHAATNRELCFLDGKGEATSGATALAAIAVAELPSPEEVERPDLRERVKRVPVERLLSGMGRCMLAMIDAEGAVFWGYREARASAFVVKEPLYFPGEVMLALVRAYKRVGDQSLLQGSKRIGDRQMRLYRPFLALGLPVSGDHWVIQALAELAEVSGEKGYAELSVLLAKGYLREQHPRIAQIYPDNTGSYYRFGDLPRTTRAASRGEALGGALRAARLTGADPSDLRAALIAGARHLAEQQFVAENSFFVPSSFDLTGAIRMGLVDNHCRIDNNQHALIAMLNALEAMDSRPTGR